MRTPVSVLLLSSLLLGFSLGNGFSQDWGSQVPQVISPELDTQTNLIFRVYAPQATSVTLNCTDIPLIGPAKPLNKGTNGVWELAFGPTKPGAYRYTFNIDGVSVIDPKNPETSRANDNTWSLVIVPGADFMDTKPVPHGSVSMVTYYSKTLGAFRRMQVYTPPGYESGKGKFPVLYLLHGAFDSDDSWPTVGRAGFILDNLIAEKKAKPMIVVMPAGHTWPNRFWGSRTNDLESDFVNDIMPAVERNYRVYTDRKHRAITGLSMGGAQTLNITISHLDQFAYIGVLSSGVFGINGEPPWATAPTWEEKNKSALDNAKLKKGLRVFWFATGKEDFLLKTSDSTVTMLRNHGFDIKYHESEGGHNWIVWREYLNEFAPMLF